MMVNLVIGCMLLAVFITQTACVSSKNRLLCYDEEEDPCFTFDVNSNLGPSCWTAVANSHCCDESGSLQSPIDITHPKRWSISENRLRYVYNKTDKWCDGDDDNGHCYNRNIKLRGRLENNGIYPKFVSDQDETVYLINTKINSMERYILADIHFHIGKPGDDRQTENLLNGKSFDAEAHIVHYNEKYDNASIAKYYSDGILVVSIFLSVSEGKRSCAFNKILRQLPYVKDFNVAEDGCPLFFINKSENNTECAKNKHLNDGLLEYDQDRNQDRCNLHARGKPCGKPVYDITINPNDLLSKTPKYLVFDGGLTTPTCSESVKWLVAKYPTRINKHVPFHMRDLQTRLPGEKIGKYGNLRPLQNVAGRLVRHMTYKRSQRCSKDDDRYDDDERECDDDDDECECGDYGDDDECECDDDDDKCDSDREDDDRRNSMTLKLAVNWRGREHERGDN